MSQHTDFSNATHTLQLNLNLKQEDQDAYEKEELGLIQESQNPVAAPTICGLPLKYVS